MKAKVVKRFRRWQRPIAWTMLPLSIIAFVSIVAAIWKVQDKVSAGLGALILLYTAFQAVIEAEQLDDDG